MSDTTLISYAQNGEDVVLWRALSNVTDGRYVDVGACDPVDLSVTKALYDRGWRGIDIDAVPEYVAKLREARPGNEVVHAAITDRPVSEVTFHQLIGTGLSTLMDDTALTHERAGFERQDIAVPAMSLDDVCEGSSLIGGDLHVVKVDVEGAEAEVLRSFDLSRWRPWVVVVEATKPLSTEPSFQEWDPILVDAGYKFTLFDGLSRFYVSPDHQELAAQLSYPSCALDDYVPIRQHVQDLRVDTLAVDLEGARDDAARSRADAARWRNEAVAYWAQAVAKAQASEEAAKHSHTEATRARSQLAKARDNLQQVRADRNRLRARVKRMSARMDRMVRETAQVPPPRSTLVMSARGRLGAAARRLRAG